MNDFEHTEAMREGLSRRGFLSGLAVGGALLVGGLAGCSTGKPDSDTGDAKQEEAEAATSTAPDNIVETIDTDIVIVGAGISGLAAAVQAGQNGNSVILLEKSGKSAATAWAPNAYLP